MKILSVDPGEKRIGVAVSDPTGTIARPLAVLRHTRRAADAARLAALAAAENAELIVVGLATDAEGRIGPQARKAERLAESLRATASVPVELWDESYTTQAATEARRISRRRRTEDLDAIAAAALLQSYLDAH